MSRQECVAGLRSLETDSWRPMAWNASETHQGGEAEEGNGARVAANRSRLTLAIIGEVRLDRDQPAPIVWQLVQPTAPRDDVMLAPGEERVEGPRPDPEAAPDDERHAEASALTQEPAPGEEHSAEESRSPRASPTAEPRSAARATGAPSMHREAPASAEAQTAAALPPEPAAEPLESEGPPRFSGMTIAYASKYL